MNHLENDTIRLRALEPEDVDLLYSWENNTKIWQISNTLTPFSRHVLTEYIENAQYDIFQARQLRLMIEVIDEESPRTVGCIDLFDFDPVHLRAGVGILINNQNDRRKHFATKALQALIAYSFNVLRLHQLYCNISVDNKISLGLFQKQGFVITGEKRDWINTADGWVDEYLLQLLTT